MEESGPETLPQLKKMAKQEQLQILKYFLNHVNSESTGTQVSSLPFKERFVSDIASQIKAGKKIREKLHERLKQQMNAGQNIRYRKIDQHPLFGHICHDDLMSLARVQKEIMPVENKLQEACQQLRKI